MNTDTNALMRLIGEMYVYSREARDQIDVLKKEVEHTQKIRMKQTGQIEKLAEELAKAQELLKDAEQQVVFAKKKADFGEQLIAGLVAGDAHNPGLPPGAVMELKP